MNKRLFLFLALLPALFFGAEGFASEIRKGARIQAPTPVFKNEKFLKISGDLVGLKSINISGDVLAGRGTLKAPEINIDVQNFQFTGAINCSEKCMINSVEPFNVHTFTPKGEGEFVINGKVFVKRKAHPPLTK
jgi:hypothetical protein